jgi:hypothetical protein
VCILPLACWATQDLPRHHQPDTNPCALLPPPLPQDFAKLAEVQFLDLRRGASINYADLQPNQAPQTLADAYRLLALLAPQVRQMLLFCVGMRAGLQLLTSLVASVWLQASLSWCKWCGAAGQHAGERHPHPAGGGAGPPRQVGLLRLAGRQP